MKDQFGKAIDRLGSRGQLLVVGIAVATIAVVVYLVSSAGGAAQATAFTNLDPKTAGQIESALASAGIPTKLVQGGSAISVPSSKVDAARIAIAKSNLPINGSGTQDGWSLFDKSSMSETDMQQQVKYQRALSGEIASTIESVDGVQAAIVNLAIPKDTVFTADQQQPTASVLLTTGGSVLTDDAIRGIVRLVSAAVPGLTAENVTVTNERGELLSSTMSSIGFAASDRLSAEAAWNRRMTAKAQGLLDTMLGVGNATAVVTGQLNLDQVNKTSQTFEKSVAALQSSKESEKLKQGAATPGGTAGTASNIPGTPAATTTAATSPSYDHSTETNTNAVPFEQTTTSVAPGDVRKMSIAMTATDASVCAAFGLLGTTGCPAATKGPKGGPTQKSAKNLAAAKASLAAQVQQALGWDKTRDGALSFQFASLATLPSTAAQLKQAGIATGSAGGAAASPLAGGPLGMATRYGKTAGAALGLLLFLFMTRRALKRRQALLSTTDTSWLPALEAPAIRVEDLLPAADGPSPAELEAVKKRQLQERVEGIATDRPQEVAMAIRGWLASGE